jgi:BirA family biotin operon repressor/biotin-[acetyl-CoA-carboxylase] ligase
LKAHTLDRRPPLRVFERFAEVESTNDVARHAPVGTVVIAERQTAGRGRFGRPWHSPRGGLWLSAHVRPRRVAWLTAVAALAAGDAVRQVSGLTPLIRFPNDLIVYDRKLCGVLIESRPPTAVVGLGLNVNIAEFPPDLSATSLQIETGRTFDLDDAARAVVAGLDRWIDADPAEIRRTYLRRDGVAGRRIVINDTIEGVVRAVDPLDGILLADSRHIPGAHIRQLTLI